MKFIIRFSIIAVLISLTSEISAQTFGIKAGFNLSDMLIKESEFFMPYDYTADKKTKFTPCFNVGVTAELAVFDMLSIEADLLLAKHGTNYVEEEPFGTTTLVTKAKYNLYYLELPLIAKVPFTVSNFKFYGAVGGYGGMGLTGKINKSYTFGDLSETEDEKIEWGSGEGVDDLKRFDYGLTFGAGLYWKSFQAGISYNLGLANISPASDYGSRISNSGLGVSVAYMFGGSNKSKPEKVKEVKTKEEKPADTNIKSEKPSKVKTGGKKAAVIEAERIRLEKLRTDSIAAVAEKISIEKAKADSIEAARITAEKAEEERLQLEKIKADSIAAAQKAAAVKQTQGAVVYRVQFASNTVKKGSYSVTIGGKNYNTWEYQYSGAYRSTVGEFKTLAEATAFQKIVRQSGYPQAFVVALKNNVRSTDPGLFK
jgi:hypothetical protein